jgi:hypothetical protein
MLYDDITIIFDKLFPFRYFLLNIEIVYKGSLKPLVFFFFFGKKGEKLS